MKDMKINPVTNIILIVSSASLRFDL